MSQFLEASESPDKHVVSEIVILHLAVLPDAIIAFQIRWTLVSFY